MMVLKCAEFLLVVILLVTFGVWLGTYKIKRS